MPSNMVLRFRDLISETIPEHRNCIRQFGYVWWGWWNKPDEKIPRKELSQFQDMIKANGYLWVYLADSGTLRLYKGKLIEIDMAENEESYECKEFDKVPEYYFAAKYKTWFRFAKIEDTFPDEIREWSYDNASDFIHGKDIQIFQNKQISSILEMMTRCHRTIYFIQPYNPELHDLQSSTTKNKSGDQDETPIEIDKLVDRILILIEEMNQRCQYSPKRIIAPIKMPPYPKKLESSLKTATIDEKTFKDFSSSLYILMNDGHKNVTKDNTIISWNEISRIVGDLLHEIKLVRCDLHHSEISSEDKRKLGKIYATICGKNILDDSDSRLKVQLEFLKKTAKILEKECEFVKSKLTESPFNVS
jgi:hypothetical protein